ncbi:MAG: efflux RND transporter periplasmic adaptor subunit, partial [Candidatus Korobacteraceae bacterium]
LRVYISVPQAYAPAIKTGMDAVVTLQEFPGQKFIGTVVRTADSIDTATRTLLTEVDVPNKDGKLLPGSFGEVHFNPHIDVNKVTVPVNAMLFRREGPQVAVVGSDGKVQLRRISIGKDYGTTLEIVGGVDVNDRVIVNPSDSIEDGEQVNVAPQSQGGQQS